MLSWLRSPAVGLGIVVMLVIGGSPAAAQETTGTIVGVVTDETGAMLPGVTVVVRNVRTDVSREFVTNEAGRYTAALLPVGDYEVTFQLPGFSSRTVRGIRLSVADRLEVNGRLGVGAIEETIEVSAASTYVQPVPAVQNLMNPVQVQELPLNNRVFVQLATLVPGVSSDLPDEVGIGLASVVSISIAGARRNAVNWMVDGVSNVDVGSNITLLSTPTLESIEEFKIITSSYAAEWPRSGGGIVNVVTKSGTSDFSGSAYEFFRNDALNSNSFFRKMSTNPEVRDNPPRLRYNNFGYTIGGPIVRDRAFFFFSQEWRRIRRAPASLLADVPDPTWLTDPNSPNYVPPELRDPNAMRLLQAYPAPNVPGANQFLSVEPTVSNTRQEVIRVDYELSPNWRLTGRYTHDWSQTVEPAGLFGSGSVVPNVGATDTQVPGNVAAAQLRTILGNGMNEFSYHLSGNHIQTLEVDGNRYTRDDFGLAIPTLFPENLANRMPTVAVAGLSSLGAGQPWNIQYWNHTFTNNYTHVWGTHTMKAGLMATFEQKNENAANVTHGWFTFPNIAGRTGFQSFVMGNADGFCTACSYFEDEIDITNNLRFNRYEMFVQDSWRMRPNVTLDYGVRYAVYPGVIDRNDVMTNFVPGLYDPARAPDFANAPGTLIVPGTGDPLNGIVVAGQTSPHGRRIYPTDWGNIQPRVGLSWDPWEDGRTIVRSHYGIYYDQPLIGIFEQNAFVNPPFSNRVSVTNPALSNPAAGVPPATAGLRALIASSDPFDTPRTQQWNAGVQRQLYSRGIIDVSYVGSRGDNLIQPLNLNQPQPADVVAAGGFFNRVRPFPGYGNITFRQTTARANYHGLLAGFRHEHGRFGSVTLNYTLSRNRTTATNDRDAIDFPQNPLDLEAEYADARTDRRHIFSGTFIYELPFLRESPNAAARAVLGGWQLAGIVNASSGPPIPRITVPINNFTRGDRANQIGDPGAGQQPDRLQWFNPAAFAPPAPGQYGTSPRAPFRLPGRHQWDLAISKNWYPTDRTRVQFRAELINAFNQVQFTTVNAACIQAGTADCSQVPATTFGRVTGTRAPREAQFGLKFYW